MLLAQIKKLCKETGTTVTELERILGFGNGTMHKWENVQPSADKVVKVAEYFDVSVDYLLGRDNDLPTQEARAIAKVYDEFSEEKKGLLKCYITILQSKTAPT